MNTNHDSGLSPNTFRRLLAAHGRSTTPGVFQESGTLSGQAVMDIIDKKPVIKQESPMQPAGTASQVMKEPQEPDGHSGIALESEREVANSVVKNAWPPRGSMINPPISKIRSTTPQIATSYSFYKRPFKVHGKEAWEFAMRDLGSIDTLLNRYGYVEPRWRREGPSETLEKQPSELEVETNSTNVVGH